MRGFYLDNFASCVASHFVSPELFTSGFGVRLGLFQPGKKIIIFRRDSRSILLQQIYDAGTIILF